jgi:hypothetical protein
MQHYCPDCRRPAAPGRAARTCHLESQHLQCGCKKTKHVNVTSVVTAAHALRTAAPGHAACTNTDQRLHACKQDTPACGELSCNCHSTVEGCGGKAAARQPPPCCWLSVLACLSGIICQVTPTWQASPTRLPKHPHTPNAAQVMKTPLSMPNSPVHGQPARQTTSMLLLSASKHFRGHWALGCLTCVPLSAEASVRSLMNTWSSHVWLRHMCQPLASCEPIRQDWQQSHTYIPTNTLTTATATDTPPSQPTARILDSSHLCRCLLTLLSGV